MVLIGKIRYVDIVFQLNDTNKRLAKVEADLQHEQISHEEEGDNDELDCPVDRKGYCCILLLCFS